MGWSFYDILKNDQKNLVRFNKKHKEPVPRQFWEEGDFYRNFPNEQWKKLTEGKFPAKEKANEFVHTMYIYDKVGYEIKICPTTTKSQWEKPYMLLPKDTDMDIKKSEKDVYILIKYSRPYPHRPFKGDDHLLFDGHAPKERLKVFS